MSTKTIQVKITSDQYSLARRRMWAENLTWRQLINALLNAFIMGDITVTKQGRYHLAPPTSAVPVIEVPKYNETVELEPDWNLKGENRPQVGADEPKQKPRHLKSWGTREMALYLRQETGRRISIPVLRKLLSVLGVPKGDNSRWNFTGPLDPNIPTIKEAIEDGTYDTLLSEGIRLAEDFHARKQRELEEMRKAKITNEKARKIKHLKSLRKIETQ